MWEIVITQDSAVCRVDFFTSTKKLINEHKCLNSALKVAVWQNVQEKVAVRGDLRYRRVYCILWSDFHPFLSSRPIASYVAHEKVAVWGNVQENFAVRYVSEHVSIHPLDIRWKRSFLSSREIGSFLPLLIANYHQMYRLWPGSNPDPCYGCQVE